MLGSIPLRIGDIISLRHAKPNDGWLASEGILKDGLVLIREPRCFENCLWEVSVQNQYNAIKEYEDKMARLHKDDTEDEEDLPENQEHSVVDSSSLADQLVIAAMNENRLNEKLMSMKTGKLVTFGDVIQLRHLKSRKFLTVSTSALAKHERENMRVDLHDRGDSMSWLEFMPRYKYDREGQQIVDNNECYIRVHERSSEYIHAARKAAKGNPDGNKEINCSLETSIWTINIYQQARETRSKNIVAGNLVSLQEPETSTYLTLDQQKPGLTERANVIMSNSMQLSFAVSDCNVGTNLLWMIERDDMFTGGPLLNRASRIALRDLNTGLYMKVDGDAVTAVRDRRESSRFEVFASQHLETGTNLQDGVAVQLVSDKNWMTLGVKTAGGATKSQCAATTDRALALSMVMSVKTQRSFNSDLFVGVEAACMLRQFEATIRDKSLFLMSYGMVEAEFKTIFGCLDFLADFLNPPLASNKDIFDNDVVAALEPVGAATVVIRQTMLREQGILQVLLDIIEMCALGMLNGVDELKLKPMGSMMSMASRVESKVSSISTDDDGDMFDVDRQVSRGNSRGSFALHKKSILRLSFAQKVKGMKSLPRQSVADVVLQAVRNKKLVSSSSTFDASSAPLPKAESKRKAGSLMHQVSSELLDKKTNSEKKNSIAADLARECLNVVYIAIRKNHVSQISIADYFPLLLNQVKDQDLAVACVQEVLRDNLQMLQTKIRDREIKIFLDLLVETEMNVTLLKLLRSTCTCPSGVDNTQRMVANALYHREDMFRKNTAVEQQAEVWKKKALQSQGKGNSRGMMRANTDKGGGVNAFGFVAISQNVQSDKLMKKCHSVLISVKPDKGSKRKESWSEKKMYFPADGDMSCVRGYTLVSDGVPNLVFSWFASSSGVDDYSMLTLFGCVNEVPFRFLCNITDSIVSPHSRSNGRASIYDLSSTDTKKQIPDMGTPGLRRGSVIQSKRRMSIGIKSPSRKLKRNISLKSKTVLERKKQVADYFVAQMYLVADLCLDRNYVAIELLEKLYSFDMLLTILKMKYVPSEFKAPVCRVIRCLYVDRDPQVEAKFPRLVKTTTALKGDQVSTFQDFHHGSPYAFGLLQQIISDYFHDGFDATKCDELSAEMVDLLQDLIKFGFYSTPEQLQDIINPLVDALDNHRCHNLADIKAAAREDDSTDYHLDEISMQQVVAASVAVAAARKQSAILTAPSSSPLSSRPSFMAKRIAPESGGKDEEATAALMRRASMKGLGMAGPKLTKKPSEVEHIKAPEKKAEVEDKDKIQLKILRFLESLKVLLFVLLLVVATTTISALEIVEPSTMSGTGIHVFDLAVSVFFMTELTIRMYCYAFVHRELTSFVQSPLNALDIVVVSMDLALLSIDTPALKNAGNFAKTLKTIRILRLIRFIRAARVLKRIADRTKETSNWTMPARYAATSTNEVRTLAGILKVISIVHDRIQDRKLTSAFNAFVTWYDMESTDKKGRDAMDIYNTTMNADASWAAFIPAKFDDALLDVVMYSDPQLVQEALHLLMVHKSDEQRLREAMARIQIISHPRIEEKYKEICSYVKLMKQHAESFEIWGEFNTDDDDKVADELYTIIVRISDLLKINATTKVVEFEPPHTEDPEIQKVLANLSAMEEMMAVQVALLDASLGEPHPTVIKIIRACNELISDFVKNNEDNQKIAFTHLSWFLDKVDDCVMSSKVVRSILTGNSFLIKQCQRKYLTEFMQKIIINGRKYEYLDLFVGMTDIADTGDSGVAAVRSEIARHLTNVDRSAQILLWCCSPGSAAYKERQRAMEPFLVTDPANCFDDFTSDLQYHISLVHLLAGCKLGPKLQAVYAMDDILYAILDKATIFAVKKTLGLLLLDCTETRVEGMESSELMWRFFMNTCDFFEQAAIDMPLWLRQTSVHNRERQCYSEWMHICTKITVEFFSEFDYTIFYEATTFESEYTFKTTTRSEEDVNGIMLRLGNAIRHLVEKQENFLGTSCKDELKGAVSVLSHIHSELTIDENKAEVALRTKRRSQVNRQKSLSDEIQQAFYRKQFALFLTRISVSEDTLRESAVTTFERIPPIADPVPSDVRLEPFLLKLTTHIRTQIEKTSAASTLNKNVTTATVWLLRTLRFIVEKSLGFNTDQICDPLCNIEVLNVSWFHDILNTTGVTFLCLDLIAIGIEVNISVEAAKMLTVLCAKTGGNIVVQRTAFRYLSETDSTLFFEQVKEILEMQMLWCQRFAESEEVDIQQSHESVRLPDALVLLKMIHLICDGNFVSTKQFLREQEGNSRFVNVLDSIASFADVLSRLESHKCTQVAIRVMDTILGLLQGPSISCQEHFVLHTDMLVALNRLMRSSRPSVDFTPQWGIDIETLKEYVIDVMRASIEGLPEGSVVVERVQTAIEVNVLNVLIVPTEVDEFGMSVNLTELSRLQAKYLVFLKTLNDKNAEMPPNAVERIDEDTASIEVVWDQKLYQHYFHIPEIAKDLSESSKWKIIEQMSCTSQEFKLKDFIKQARDLYREAVHQQALKSYGISNVWHFVGTLSWIMFANVIVMNVLLTIYYVEDSDGIFLPDHINNILFALNIVHVVFSSITLVVAIIVRVPVSYSTFRACENSVIVALVRAITGKLPMWHFCYLGVAVLALWKSYLFLSVLLLDYIALDSTSRDVLYAVVIPARQLLSTFIIMVIALYMTATVIFVYFRTDYYNFTDDNQSMYNSVLLAFTYGIRATEGLGQYMFDSTGNRMILDVGIYFVIVVILRNIFFGIIINTFGELRNIKEEREEHVSNKCFICGIDRHEFDKRITKESCDFRKHRTETHNMWNYMYFIMRIWQQPRSQDTSLEMYVRQSIQSNDVSWFPIGLIGIDEKISDGIEVQQDDGLGTDDADDDNRRVRRSQSFINDSDANDRSATDSRATILDQRLNFIQSKLTDMSASASTSPVSPKMFFSSEVAGGRPSTQELVEVMVKKKTTSLQQKMLALRKTVISANGRFDEIEKEMAPRKLKLSRSTKSVAVPNSWLPPSKAPPAQEPSLL